MSNLWIGIIVSAFGVLFSTSIAATLLSWQTTRKRMAQFDLHIAELRIRQTATEQAIIHQVHWQETLDRKILALVENTAKMSGILETMRDAGKTGKQQ